MTTERHLERDIPVILGDLAMGPYPDYIDDVLATTAQRRQRPAWTFPERWLPMAVVTRRPVVAPSVPWRTIGTLAVILILIVAALAAYIGSQTRLPAPFGPARNGLIVYETGGDIYTADPVTGTATAIVTGPEVDSAPIWSRDGTHVAFERVVDGASSRLLVAGLDGRDIIAVTPEPLDRLADHAFSPDGRELVITSGPAASRTLWIAKADGSGIRQLDVGMSVDGPSYRPTDGTEIVFTSGSSPLGNGIYAVDVRSGGVRTIVAPSVAVGIDRVRSAPDGSRLAYAVRAVDPARNTYVIHVIAADGTGDVILPMPPGATFQDAPVWSNDGQRLAVARGYGLHNEDMAMATLPADGSGVGVETEHGLTGCCDTVYEWAPDDTTILMKPFDLVGRPLPPLFWDPLDGSIRPARWTATSDPAWQRLVP
jgi:dipeptidyl aminopeptidase/acylaminoacyl peptidase